LLDPAVRYPAPVIGWLTGTVVDREPASVVLDVGGVGYEVAIAGELLGMPGAPGAVLTLWIHSHATSESPSPTLFGFTTSSQRRVFRLLLKVKGIGPKLALAIVGRLGADGVAEAVRGGDVARLKTVPGVGKKTAQQVILDLAGQLAAIDIGGPATAAGEASQVASALLNLGFKRPQVDRALRILAERGEHEGPLEEVIRRALPLAAEV
jgi:Holliday junction DNA helicase RuvA